jgi:hypothetical protein
MSQAGKTAVKSASRVKVLVTGNQLRQKRLELGVTIPAIAKRYCSSATGFYGVDKSEIRWIESLRAVPEEREYRYMEALNKVLRGREGIRRLRETGEL